MKESLNQYIEDYTKSLDSENLMKGYRGLMKYLLKLRTHFTNRYPSKFIVGSFYQGYMDISYFPITPIALKNQKVKIGLVFNHEKARFEIWFLGHNKQVQKKYWNFLKEMNWNKYKICDNAQESVIQHVLVEKPDFNQIDLLMDKIEIGTLKFIDDISELFPLIKEKNEKQV